MNKPVLTPEKLDAMLDVQAPQYHRRIPSLAAESLWGAQAIADFMGVSDDFVRKCAKSNGSPIRRIEGRYYCTRSEIVLWLSGRDNSID